MKIVHVLIHLSTDDLDFFSPLSLRTVSFTLRIGIDISSPLPVGCLLLHFEKWFWRLAAAAWVVNDLVPCPADALSQCRAARLAVAA